ncbi:MAG: hypothetical protein AAFX76_04750 [Planctomycetota bacterium]
MSSPSDWSIPSAAPPPSPQDSGRPNPPPCIPAGAPAFHPSPRPEPDPASDRRPARWSRSLGAFSWLALLAFVAVSVLIRAVLPGPASADAGEIFVSTRFLGAIVGVPFWALLFSLIAFYVSGCRPRASAGAFIAVLVLATIAQFGRFANAGEAAHNQRVLAELVEERDRDQAWIADDEATQANDLSVEEILAALEAEKKRRTASTAVPLDPGRDPFAANPESQVSRMERELDRLDRFAGRMRGDDKQMFEAAADAMRTLEAPIKDYFTALETLAAAGGIDPVTLPNRKTIRHRMLKLDAVAEAGVAMGRAVEHAEPYLRARLAECGVEGPEAEAFLEGWKQGANLDLVRRIRETDVRLVAAMRGLLQTLHDGVGHWVVDRHGEVMFDDGDLLARYNTYFLAMESAARDQIQAQRLLAFRTQASPR